MIIRLSEDVLTCKIRDEWEEVITCRRLSVCKFAMSVGVSRSTSASRSGSTTHTVEVSRAEYYCTPGPTRGWTWASDWGWTPWVSDRLPWEASPRLVSRLPPVRPRGGKSVRVQTFFNQNENTTTRAKRQIPSFERNFHGNLPYFI